MEDNKKKLCMNTHSCHGREARPGSNFCSDECKEVYEGKGTPDYQNHMRYMGDDLMQNTVNHLFCKYYAEKDKPPSKPKGVKPGVVRGSYKKPKLSRQKKREKKIINREKTCERVQRYRKRKMLVQIERNKAVFQGDDAK